MDLYFALFLPRGGGGPGGGLKMIFPIFLTHFKHFFNFHYFRGLRPRTPTPDVVDIGKIVARAW